jgi:hypothetical protein
MSTWQVGARRRYDVARGGRGSQESGEWYCGDTGILKGEKSVEKAHYLFFNFLNTDQFRKSRCKTDYLSKTDSAVLPRSRPKLDENSAGI